MNSLGLAVLWLAGCAFGVALLSRYPQGLNPVYGWLLVASALLLLTLALFARGEPMTHWGLLFAAVGLAACGMGLLGHPPATTGSLAYYNSPAGSPPLTMVGTVASEPVLSDRSQRLRISVMEIRLPDASASKQVTGDLIAIVSRYPVYETGERLLLAGSLTAPPSGTDFDYAAYLARQGVYSYVDFPRVRRLGPGSATSIQSLVADARGSARDALKRLLPQPESALAVGVVVGDRTSMSPGVQEDFIRSGTVHVLAISGENIALLVGFLWLLYSSAGGGRRMPLPLLSIVLLLLFAYTLFTGGTASVVRAAVMATVLLLAPVVGRRYDPLAALAMSAVAMTIFNPPLIFDAGFDLSFGAMLGIAAVAPAIRSGLLTLRMPNVLASLLAAGLGAQFLTTPMTLLLTGRVSLVGPIATLIIDPALLPLMICGIGVAIAGQFSFLAPVAALLGWLTWLPAAWMVLWTHLWASLPFASIDLGSIDPRYAWIYYGLLILLLTGPSNLSRVLKRFAVRRETLRVAGVAGASVLALWGALIWLVILR